MLFGESTETEDSKEQRRLKKEVKVCSDYRDVLFSPMCKN